MKSEDLYAHLDKDRDGEISPAEFRQMELTSEHKKVYGVFDKDGDRDITGGGQTFWLNLLDIGRYLILKSQKNLSTSFWNLGRSQLIYNFSSMTCRQK